jgi:RNA polymerase sigma factor (sigma-70 family)
MSFNSIPSTPSSSGPSGSGDHDGESPPAPAKSELWPETDHPALATLRDGSDEEKTAALHRLFRAYAPPLRRYIRHHWPLLQASDIDDLASEFITRCLTGEKAHFLTYKPALGAQQVRLRTYLATVLDNFLRNHCRRNRAQIRGGDRQFESLDTVKPAAHQEKSAGASGPSRGLDIEAYDRHWAQHIISISFVALETGTPNNREWLPILRPWILADPGQASLKEIAREKGCTHDSVRANLYRLRKCWRKAVRDAVCQTLVDPSEVDDELRHLAAVLSRHPQE